MPDQTGSPHTPVAARAAARVYYLDWLRVIAILMVFVYHSARFFNLDDWSVKNATAYSVVQAFTDFLGVWGMPLIFVVSGASVYLAMGKDRRTASALPNSFLARLGRIAAFVERKALRLLVPVAVGIFTHIALQVYLERVSHGQFSGSFFEFYPHYFEGVYGFGGNFALIASHLWYLEILFVFILLFLPLFIWLQRDKGERSLNKLGNLLTLPGAAYLLAVPVILMHNLLDPESFLVKNYLGWGLVYYMWFFIAGFLILRSDRLQENIRRWRWLWLSAACFMSAVYMMNRGDHKDVLVWLPILAILGFGLQHLNRNAPFLGYVNEGVMPFYIMHQSVLLCLGFFVVQWAIPDPVRWAFIFSVSFVIILGLYEFLVRRFNLMRFLFGMKPIRRPTSAVTLPGIGPHRSASWPQP